MAGMGKVKALQIWCKNRVMGYRDVEITNMTSSWRDGMAFCALIHKFRPDLIDYDSLSKENVFENNELAFEVAEGLGIPALLDAEDMVKLEVPDKLSIITYVAQLHNYFKDKEPAGSPGLKSAAPKRHSTPVQRSVTMRSPESKRKPALSTSNKSTESSTTSPGAGICVACDGKVYLIEKHLVDGKLYHRSCYRRNNRSERPASVLISSSQTPQSTSTPLRPISTPPQSVSTPARPTATPPQSISTPLRPVSLASNGLKKPSTSLPSTPGTPPDTRPEWQRRIQDKSARRNVVGAINKTSGLAPLNENSSSSQTSTPVLPKTEAERVQLRSKAVDSVIRKFPLPRAVSVGVDLDERITKLRQLRASAKASGAPSSPALKARLEKLKDLSASGRLQVDSSSDKRSTQEKSNTKSENVGSKTEHPDTNSSNVGSKSERLDTSPSSSASKFDQSTSSLGSAVSKPVEAVNSVDSVGSEEEELRISEVVPTSSKIEDKEAADKQTTADAQGASVCSQTRDFGASEKENIPGDSDTLHTNRTSHSDTHEEVCSDSSAQVSADSKTTCVGIVHEQTDKTSVAGDQEDSVEMAATQSVKKSTNPFEDDSDDTSVPSHQVSSITEETIRLQISPPPLAPARHRRSAASKSLSSTNHSSAVTKSSPSATSAHKDTETTALPTRLSAGPSGITVKAGKPDRPSVSPAVARRLTNKEGDSLSTASTNTGVMSPHDTSAGTVVMRQKHASPKQPPHRPATAAAGSASKSHFYMDESHTEVREPPPKPARQSAIVHAVSKAKPGNWEDSLQSWSSKRKDRQRTTWYTTESYPTENNPFGEEEEEEVEGSNVDQSSAATSEYDNSLNPFAEDDEEDDKVVVTSKPSESNNSSCEEPQRRKIIPTNPFEVSDDEEDVPTDRKKVIPEQELSSSSSINQSASKKANNVIVLPDTSNKRTTPKKKAAPPPPQQTTPISSHTPPTQTSPSNKSSSLQAPPTNQEDTNTEIFITNEEPINNELTNEEAGNAEVNRKKHRPAPPRPLPPKRRVQTEFGLDPEDIDRELASLDVKQQQLEERGRQLEQALRTAERAAIESNESINEDDELLTSWLETVNEKNQLVRRESELIFISKHHELETKQADIEYELRQIMHRAENLKSDEDKRREEELLSELVSVVHSRSQLVDKMDDERIRQQEEDVEINMALSATLAADKSPATNPVEGKKAAKKKTDKKKKKEKKPK